MTLKGSRIAPCLWFDSEAEPAARFYTSIFPNSSIGGISTYGKEGHEIHGQPEGSVLTVDFILDGHPFTALNGGPHFTFNEAISLQVLCSDQEEVDYYWERLSEGVIRRLDSAGGSRTASACPGRWSRSRCRSCSTRPIPCGRGG